MKISAGQIWQSRENKDHVIKIICRHKISMNWITKKMNGSRHSHRISEHTLLRYFTLLDKKAINI